MTIGQFPPRLSAQTSAARGPVEAILVPGLAHRHRIRCVRCPETFGIAPDVTITAKTVGAVSYEWLGDPIPQEPGPTILRQTRHSRRAKELDMKRMAFLLASLVLAVSAGQAAADPGHQKPRITVMRWQDPPVTANEPGCEELGTCTEEILILRAHDPDW